jgi:hypothetical protein
MIRLLLALTLSVFALAPASAQYQWRDAKGRMVFSDMPPPQTVAKTQIIRGFKPKPRPVQEAADKAAAEAAQGAGQSEPRNQASISADDAPKPTESRLAARLAEFDKRRDERLKARKDKAQKDKVAARKKALCRNLHADNRALTSGMRLARVNEKGEREIIDEKAKQIRLRENRELLAKHCTTG